MDLGETLKFLAEAEALATKALDLEDIVVTSPYQQMDLGVSDVPNRS